jgi:hypothetical protein
MDAINNVEIIDGIGFGSRSGAMFKALGLPGYGAEGTQPATPPVLPYLSSSVWSFWGDDNLLPVTLADHIENCGVLNAGLDTKSRIAAGKGVEPFFKTGVDADGKDILEWCSDVEIHEWLEENELFEFTKEAAFDSNGYGWNAGSLILNTGRDKINRIRRIDVYEARQAKKLPGQRFSTDIFLCSDWSKSATGKFDPNKQARIAMLQDGNEFNDLADRIKGGAKDFEFAFINRLKRNGRQYYPLPLWYSSVKWVQHARSIPNAKNAMFLNQILLRYVVTIHPQYWEENVQDWHKIKTDPIALKNAQKNTFDRIDQWLSGEANAGKSMFNGGFFEKITGKFVPYVQVEAIDDKFTDGKWLPDSAAANSEILFALNMNPALMGAGQPGGAYSNNAGGSNVRESYLVQMMLLDAERKMNTRLMNVVKKFNGWAARLEKETTVTTSSTTRTYTPRLVFRFQSGLLTTLDTGKSTKGEAL